MSYEPPTTTSETAEDGTITTTRTRRDGPRTWTTQRSGDRLTHGWQDADGSTHEAQNFDASLFDFEGIEPPEGTYFSDLQTVADFLEGAATPMDRLHRAAELAAAVESAIARAAQDANAAGKNWSEIGSTLGITRQTAAKRYSRRR